MTDCIRCKWYGNCTIREFGLMAEECDGFQDMAELRSACDEKPTSEFPFDKNRLAVPDNFTDKQLIIECDKVILRENGQEVEFDFENNKVNNVKTLIINGIKFEKIEG